jgi:hypothetical protein
MMRSLSRYYGSALGLVFYICLCVIWIQSSSSKTSTTAVGGSSVAAASSTASTVPSAHSRRLASGNNAHHIKKEGILVIPGIGRVDRLQTTVSNLHMLSDYLTGVDGKEPTWDCIAYIYAFYNDTTFWGTKDLPYLLKTCDIVENPGKRVTENLYMAQPALLRSTYEYVFILLDDCKLLGNNERFALDFIVRIMKQSRLGVASPMVGSVICSIMRLSLTAHFV